MDYYLEIDESANDPILIGTVSFGYFYEDTGFDMLMKCVDHGIKFREDATIRDQMGNIISIENFISILEGVKMRKKAE